MASAVLQPQVQARHVDAARSGIGQVDRHIDARRHLQLPAGAIGDPHRQRDAFHADPVQRTRQGHGVAGDIGKIGGKLGHVADTGDRGAEQGALYRRAPGAPATERYVSAPCRAPAQPQGPQRRQCGDALPACPDRCSASASAAARRRGNGPFARWPARQQFAARHPRGTFCACDPQRHRQLDCSFQPRCQPLCAKRRDRCVAGRRREQRHLDACNHGRERPHDIERAFRSGDARASGSMPARTPPARSTAHASAAAPRPTDAANAAGSSRAIPRPTTPAWRRRATGRRRCSCASVNSCCRANQATASLRCGRERSFRPRAIPASARAICRGTADAVESLMGRLRRSGPCPRCSCTMYELEASRARPAPIRDRGPIGGIQHVGRGFEHASRPTPPVLVVLAVAPQRDDRTHAGRARGFDIALVVADVDALRRRRRRGARRRPAAAADAVCAPAACRRRSAPRSAIPIPGCGISSTRQVFGLVGDDAPARPAASIAASSASMPSNGTPCRPSSRA